MMRKQDSTLRQSLPQMKIQDEAASLLEKQLREIWNLYLWAKIAVYHSDIFCAIITTMFILTRILYLKVFRIRIKRSRTVKGCPDFPIKMNLQPFEIHTITMKLQGDSLELILYIGRNYNVR